MTEPREPTVVFGVMPDQGITMSIYLLANGIAEINFLGSTTVGCWCGKTHGYAIDVKMHADSAMEPLDMNDLDAAIHGDEKAARRFAWRRIQTLFFREIPPCERMTA